MKRSVEQMIPDVWRLFLANLVLFVPPVFIFFVYIAIFFAFAVGFGFSVFLKVSDWKEALSTFSEDTWRELLSQVSLFAGAMFLSFLAVLFVVNVIHGSGWGNMFSRAAAAGRTGLGDYFEGISRFVLRIAAGSILKLCVQMIPVLGSAVVVAGLVLGGGGGGWAAGGVAALLLFPLVLASELAIALFLWMWRPACFIEDVSAVEAFSRSFSFVRKNFFQIVILFLIWIVAGMFVAGLFALIRFAGQMAVQSGGWETGLAALYLMITFGANVVSSLLSLAIATFFLLFFYRLYVERTPAPGVPPGPPPPPDYGVEWL
ncbi:MAG: hypothetical protein AB1742_00345 [bacterium]